MVHTVVSFHTPSLLPLLPLLLLRLFTASTVAAARRMEGSPELKPLLWWWVTTERRGDASSPPSTPTRLPPGPRLEDPDLSNTQQDLKQITTPVLEEPEFLQSQISQFVSV